MSAAPTRWWAVTVLTLTGALAGAHVYKLSPALPVLRADLELGLVAAGWLFSIVNVLSLVLGIIAGTVSDRIGHRRVLVTGLIVLGMASLVGSLSTTQAQLLVWRFFEGVGFLTVVIAAPSLIAGEVRKRDRAMAFGIWGAYLPLGAALVVLAAPFIMDWAGWRGLWQVTGALSIVFLALVIRIRPAVPASDRSPVVPTGMAVNIVRTVSTLGPWLPCIGFGLYTLQFTALMGWLPTYMVESRGLAHGLSGLLTAVVIAANIPGNLLGSLLLRRGLSHGGVVLLASVLMAAMAITFFHPALPDAVRYGACVGLSLFGGMIPASVLGAAPLMAPSPSQIGTTNGLIVQGSNFGNVLGPPLLAALATLHGRWEDAIWMFVAATALNMGLGLVLRRQETRLSTDKEF